MLQAIFTTGVDEVTVLGLTQWDRGQQLQITLDSLPESFCVHYSVKGKREADVVEATAENGVAVVNIPNAILQQDKDAVAWIYVGDDKTAETIKTIHLPIERRAKPNDYIYEEDDLLTLGTVLASVKTSEVSARNYATETKTARNEVVEAAEYVEQTEASLREAMTNSTNPPYVGNNGNWFVFNESTAAYEDSGTCAVAFARTNLLDNSDFRNVINQRGETTYGDAYAAAYTIDRWKRNNARNGSLTVNAGTGIALSRSLADNSKVYILQYVNETRKLHAGKKYTLAAMTPSGEIYATAATYQAESFAITRMPVDFVGVVGETATFTVEVKSDEPLTYQWQFKNASNVWESSGMTGSQTASMSVPITAARDGYMYRCVIENASGDKSYTRVVTLTVVTADELAGMIRITSHPADAVAQIDETVTFAVAAEGEGLTYRWEWKQPSATETWQISSGVGATTNTLTVEAKDYRDGYMYRCVVTNTAGHTATTETAKLVIRDAQGQTNPALHSTMVALVSIPNGEIALYSRGSTLLPCVQICVTANTVPVELAWVALYEGEYTAETLPPYVSKGYAAELAECQRYLYVVKPEVAYLPMCSGIIKGASRIWYNVAFPTKMRITPTFSYGGGTFTTNTSMFDYISSIELKFADKYRALLDATTQNERQTVLDACSILCGDSGSEYLEFNAEL